MRVLRSYTERLLSGTFIDGDAGAGAGGGAAGAAGAGAAGAAGAGAAGAAAPAFADTLPEDIRGDAAFKDIKDLPGLAKSYLNAHKMVGLDKGSLVAIPKADADAKAWDEFYAKAGRPEAADKYTLPKRADGKAYGDADVALQKQILPVLHKAGLTQRQIDAIVPAWNDIAGSAGKGQADARAAETAKAASTLKAEWGAAHDEKLAQAGEAIKHYARELKLGDGLVKALEDTGLGNSPELAKLFAHLGGQLKEDGLLGKGEGNSGAALSPTEAKQQIAAMEQDPEKRKALLDKSHIKHKEMVAERTRLFELAHPIADVA